MRVDRFLSNLPRFNRQQVRLLLVERRVSVDGVPVSDPHHEVREFSRVCVDDEVLQAGKPARYFMLHKPQGCVSATCDPQHPTVLDLAGRTGQGRAAHRRPLGLQHHRADADHQRRPVVAAPDATDRPNCPRSTWWRPNKPIGAEYAATFAAGVYFAFEDLTTQPAELELLGASHCARLSIIEGRYHQVKRMFGHFDNKVLRLHRERMGPLALDDALAPGEYRALSADEIRQV